MKRKIFYGALALVISIGLWLYVVTFVNPEWEETFYNIPVILENEEILNERGLMLESNEDPKITLRLSGKRTDMIKLNNSNITLRADLSRIYSAGEQRLSYSIVYPDNLPSNALEIISQSPQQITLSVVERMSKPVDVVPIIGEEDPGYIALREEAEYDKQITIIGPAEVVDRIVAAEITVDLTGEKETINRREYDYVLKDADGNIIDNKWIKAPEKILFTLKIHRVQEVTVAVDIMDGAGLTAQNCQVTYYNKETGEILDSPIKIYGSETQLAVLRSVGLLRENELYLNEKIVLSQTCGNPTQDGLEIVLEKNIDEMLAPYEITNQSSVNVVQVVVKIPGLSRENIEISGANFEYINVPAGVVPIGTSLTVVLRGPRAELDAIIAQKSLKVVVDLTGAAIGDTDKEFVATVILPEGKNVYAVGNYKATVSIRATNG